MQIGNLKGRGRSKELMDLNFFNPDEFKNMDISGEKKPEKEVKKLRVDNDIRLFIGSLNLSTKMKSEIEYFSNIQNNPRRIIGHIRRRLNRIKHYYGAFDARTILLLKILISFSDNLKSRLDELNTVFLELKIQLLTILEIVDRPNSRVQRSRTNGLTSFSMTLLNEFQKVDFDQKDSREFDLDEKCENNQKLSEKYLDIQEDEGQMKSAKLELKGIIKMTIKETNQILEIVDRSSQLYTKQSSKLNSKRFVKILELAKQFKLRFTTEASNLIRVIQRNGNIEDFNSNSQKNLMTIEFKICLLMRLFWVEIHEGYLGPLFKLKEDFKFLKMKNSDDKNFWDILYEINDLSSAIFVGNRDYMIKSETLEKLSKFDVKRGKQGFGFNLNFGKYFEEDDVRFIKNWLKKNNMNAEEKEEKSEKRILSNEELKIFFYNYSSFYTNENSLICALARRAKIVREPNSKEELSGFLCVDVR